MLNFGERKINKIGGSFMIALPMNWMQSVETDLKTVKVELNREQEIVIAAGNIRKNSTDCNTTQPQEVINNGFFMVVECN